MQKKELRMDRTKVDQIIHEVVAKYFRKPMIVAGNWKMNMTVREGLDFLEKLGSTEGNVLIFPPYTTLAVLAPEMKKRGILYGPQNFHYEDSGAFTGEISIPMIRELGCSFLLAGHSERRGYYNETDEALGKKVAKGIRSGFRVMLCIGESLEERRSGQWQRKLTEQIVLDLRKLEKEELDSVLIAYEPIWAIGTGVSASLEEINETHSFLKMTMREMFGRDLPLLYGGSVNEKNAQEIGCCPYVDGFLIGGASLNPEKFRKIIEVSRGV